MPLCNRKGSLLNLIIKDIEKEEIGNSGSRSASILPPGSPLLARSRAVAPGSPMTRRKGNSLPATASPSLHRKFPSLMLNHPSSPRLQKRLSLDSKDVESNENRRTSPVKIKHRRSSKPELYKSKFSFEEEDIVHALKVQFRLEMIPVMIREPRQMVKRTKPIPRKLQPVWEKKLKRSVIWLH